uniref:Uncharacterized protein n=1 Tax=Arundo donax TaxID=35708 RepID=A0A0A9TR81_ARUDO
MLMALPPAHESPEP